MNKINWRNRKRSRKWGSIACETYKEFAANTTVHGLKYTVKEDITIFERIFWTVAVLCGLASAIYLTFLFWNRFNSNPTRTSTMTTSAPTTAVPFPAVTICNNNGIIALKNVPSADEHIIIRRAFPQLFAYTNPFDVAYNVDDLKVLERVLLRNGYDDVGEVMKSIIPSCAEMLVKCRWEFTDVPCHKMFVMSQMEQGFCCSFNYVLSFSKKVNNGKPLYTPYSGINSGLRVLINPMIPDAQYSTVRSRGIKVMIHPPDYYPDIASPYKMIPAGRQSHLQVAASNLVCSKDMHRLTIDQRKCVFRDEMHLKYFPIYSERTCELQCSESIYMKECGCVPYVYPTRGDRPMCNITTIPCMANVVQFSEWNLTDDLLEETQTICDCWMQCEDTFYSISSTTSSVNVSSQLAHSSSFLIGENITEDSMVVQVYFLGEKHKILYKDTITSTTYLLSSFGGVYSLFLGCSFITLVEIVYYCSFRFMVNMKIFDQPTKSVQMDRGQKTGKNYARDLKIKFKFDRAKPKPNRAKPNNGIVFIN